LNISKQKIKSMIIIEICDKCKDLRKAEISTLLEKCEDRFFCLKVRLCEYHCYQLFNMCSKCLNFIQDPKNDQQLKEWELKHSKENKNEKT